MTGPEPVVYYSGQAVEAVDKIEADPEALDLWNGICDCLDLILDHPDSAPARRDALRTATGTTVWRVTVRVPCEVDIWAILWHQDDTGRILIAFVGRL